MPADQPVKILHTADLHLDSPLRSLALKDETLRDLVETASRTALQRIVGYAIDEGASALLVAGDLFDGNERSARTAAFLIAELDKLNAAGIAVFYIKGNHDAENPLTGELDLPGNVHVFDGAGGKVQLAGEDIWIHGVSFRDRHAPESLLPKLGAPVPGATNIAMLHTSLAGAPGHDPYAPCTIAELRSLAFDYWALGHVHKREVHSQDPWIVMPGMPQGRDIGEAGPKSATLITISDGTIDVSEVATSTAEFRQSAIDVSEVPDDDGLRRLLRTHLQAEAEATRSDAAILRLTLTSETGRAWQIRRDRDVWRETIAGAASETGRLWIEQVTVDVQTPVSTQETVDAADELHSIMAGIVAGDGFLAGALTEAEAMINLLPSDRRRELVPDEAALEEITGHLVEEALLSMAARFKGAAK